MRFDPFPHAASRVAAALCVCVFALIFQGCGDGEPDPYAALDAKYPDGRPAITPAAERLDDPAYREKIAQGAAAVAKLDAAYRDAQAKTARFRETIRAALAKRMGKDPTPEILEHELAKNAHHRALAQAEADAKAALDAARAANIAAIREKMWAAAKDYDAMKAKADAAAQAAGQAPRQATADPTPPPALAHRQAQTPAAAPAKTPAPTLQTLSETTGIPVATTPEPGHQTR